MMKWSFADSPAYGFGSDHFKHVHKLFSERKQLTYDMPDEEWDQESSEKLLAMETAMKNLDEKGLFGQGEEQNNIVVLVETMPPSYENTERAYRLNPPEALTEWLEEAADEDEDDE